MHAPYPAQEPGTGAGTLHAAFLAILPRIERHARIAFRHRRQKDSSPVCHSAGRIFPVTSPNPTR